MNKENGLHLDLYQINMAYVYFQQNDHQKQACFEVYFRQNPFNGGHSVFVGANKIVQTIKNFGFTKEDIDYLRTIGDYSEEFLDYLGNFKFTGDIYAPREGEVIFAQEPILVVHGEIAQIQILETILLNILNYQILVATKASKMRQVTQAKLFEFGARRGYETEASLWCAYASYICGFDGTSLVKAGKRFGIPVVGTHAHSFIQKHQNEAEAFRSYAQVFGDKSSFLIDTYDVIQSGLPNAIKVAKEMEINLAAVRIDSGDLAKLSKESRKILDGAGLTSTQIMVSNDIDEHTIILLEEQKSPIDSYGIGTKLVSCDECSSLGAVYKLVAIEEAGELRDVIKLSSTRSKTTSPGMKTTYRLFKDNQPISDIVAPFNQELVSPIKLFNESDDQFILGSKEVEFDEVKPLLLKIIDQGKEVPLPPAVVARDYHRKVIGQFSQEYLRLAKPERYPVGLCEEIMERKIKLIKELK